MRWATLSSSDIEGLAFRHRESASWMYGSDVSPIFCVRSFGYLLASFWSSPEKIQGFLGSWYVRIGTGATLTGAELVSSGSFGTVSFRTFFSDLYLYPIIGQALEDVLELVDSCVALPSCLSYLTPPPNCRVDEVSLYNRLCVFAKVE
ncbi:hypothetical protein AVEN_202322-1 [Araneus ventricosus]|uniref:Uncharacterized protein n=1 Tax=Araneus ventricosus TaxID=182803 RepID=A0A4Y2E7M8_ARAVE|nr:hypothetical protein AVEN_202322-1 [Araneus ventricosus]